MEHVAIRRRQYLQTVARTFIVGAQGGGGLYGVRLHLAKCAVIKFSGVQGFWRSLTPMEGEPDRTREKGPYYDFRDVP